MDALIALVWDTEILVTLAILGYVLGFIFKNQIFLKLPGVSLRVSSCSPKRADHEGGPANEPEEFKHA